jgi:hypothetical protein
MCKILVYENDTIKVGGGGGCGGSMGWENLYN